MKVAALLAGLHGDVEAVGCCGYGERFRVECVNGRLAQVILQDTDEHLFAAAVFRGNGQLYAGRIAVRIEFFPRHPHFLEFGDWVGNHRGAPV